MLLCAAMNSARWARFDDASRAIIDAAAAIASRPEQSLSAFDFTVICDDPALQRNAARSWTRGQAPRPHARPAAGARARTARCALGFVSTDFCNHPVGRLIVGLFERLDRRRFDRRSCMPWTRQRTTTPRGGSSAVADAFRRMASADPGAIAAAIRDDRIDVLFDLNGFTGTQMIAVFALRPAPVQVNFLGYTGTLGIGMLRLDHRRPLLHARRASALALRRTPRLRRPVLPAVGHPARDRYRRAFAVRTTVCRRMVSCSARMPPCTRSFRRSLRSGWHCCARHPRSVLWLRAAAGEVERRLRHAAAAQGIDGATAGFRAARPDPPVSRPVPPRRPLSRHVSVRRAYDGERRAVRGPARGHHRRSQLRGTRVGEPVGRSRDRRPDRARPR